MAYLVSKKLFCSVLVGAAGMCALAVATSANVSLKNGNFYIGYRDLVYPGGFEPKIERIYNSKTAFKGFFGHGWGTEYESRLVPVGDGSLTIYEYGGGAENRFTLVNGEEKQVKAAVDQLMAAAKSAGSASAQYKSRLTNDVHFRQAEWLRFSALGKVKAPAIAVGTQFRSNRFSFQYITKSASGYVRAVEGGKIENFDEKGRLLKVSDRNGNSIEFAYGSDGRPQKISDNLNRRMTLTFNAKGLLERVQGEGGKETNYRYNAEDELIYSKDQDGNVYTYGYTADRVHNLAEIGYADKTKLQLTYAPQSQYFNVKTVKDRDGTFTQYDYDYSKGLNQYNVTVQVKEPSGKEVSVSKYEYELGTKSNGEEWTKRVASTVDGERTETVYEQKSGLPVQITKPEGTTRFQYDAKGRVVLKETPDEIRRMNYDSVSGKVAKVQRTIKPDKTVSSWSEFQYDKKTGNLIAAKDSKKRAVKLFYDRTGRIASMVDQGGRRIDFKYNELSKPIEIIDHKLGPIKVSYSNSGEIKSVESPAGRQIAMEVTGAFQNLLDIIRPAGVSLSF